MTGAPLPLPELPPESWTDDLAAYQRLAEGIEPVAVVGSKDSCLWTALWVAGVVLTAGALALGVSLRRFLEEFATTFVTRQGYPTAWPTLSRRIVAHESRHTTQATWFGWLVLPLAWVSRRVRAWLGAPFFAAVYFLLPLPIGLAYGRFRLELDAEVAAWRRGLREGWLSEREVRELATMQAELLSSGAYLWAWPRVWTVPAYAAAAAAVLRERVS